MSGVNVLYRFYSITGQLLYVGITNSPPERFKSHGATKEWWDQVSGITVETYSTREELAQAERRAIQVERPLHNVVHNGARKLHRVTAPPPIAAPIEVCDCAGLPTDFAYGWHWRGVWGSAADWMYFRSEWFLDPHPVRLMLSPQGGWEVMLRIDGTYYCEDSAKEAAHAFHHEIQGMAEWMKMNREQAGTGEDAESECPICHRESVHARKTDRYFHADGSDNVSCWLAICRGEVSA
jgi:predicted GIY-YIG superfamily endonuclease